MALASTLAPRFLLHQQDPPTTAENNTTDIEDWLHLVEWVSNHDNWDLALYLASVVF